MFYWNLLYIDDIYLTIVYTYILHKYIYIYIYMYIYIYIYIAIYYAVVFFTVDFIEYVSVVSKQNIKYMITNELHRNSCRQRGEYQLL